MNIIPLIRNKTSQLRGTIPLMKFSKLGRQGLRTEAIIPRGTNIGRLDEVLNGNGEMKHGRVEYLFPASQSNARCTREVVGYSQLTWICSGDHESPNKDQDPGAAGVEVPFTASRRAIIERCLEV